MNWIVFKNLIFNKINNADFKSNYIAFVSQSNQDMLNAAFGKNNESNITGIGPALAMYAKYKNNNIDLDNFKVSQQKQTLLEISQDYNSIIELLYNTDIYNLITSNEYANSYFDLTDIGLKKIICYKLNIDEQNYNDLYSLLSDSEQFSKIIQDEECIYFMFLSKTQDTYSAIFNIQENVNSLYNSEIATRGIFNSINKTIIFNAAANSSLRKTATIQTSYGSYITAYSGNCFAVAIGDAYGQGVSGTIRTGKYPDLTGTTPGFSYQGKSGTYKNMFVPITGPLQGAITSAKRTFYLSYIPIIEEE